MTHAELQAEIARMRVNLKTQREREDRQWRQIRGRMNKLNHWDTRKGRLLSESEISFAPNAVIAVGPQPETIESVREDYVAGRMEIAEFERRVGELLADA